MKFYIRHEAKGRMRIHVECNRMSCAEADVLATMLAEHASVKNAKVYERTADITVEYTGKRGDMLSFLQSIPLSQVKQEAEEQKNSPRALNAVYQEKLTFRVLRRFLSKMFLPMAVRTVITLIKSIRYLWEGIVCLAKGRLEVPVLDAVAIGVSLLRGDPATAGSIMFLLGIGELLEEWTHKKSVADLAQSMALQVDKVWLLEDGQEILVDATRIREKDQVVVHMGNVVPFDGTVVAGEAMLNQASLTGESMPVRKIEGASVYAGTTVEEGEITLSVREVGGGSHYEQIMAMIEASEKLKSSSESKAEHIADKLVPYTLGATVLTYLLTRNATKALSVLMVDFCCALKLAMPISVLSAIRESNQHHISVKGGKFLEAVAEADTIVFDKTGTLTKAQPRVTDVISFDPERNGDELLRIAACLEEHFPHSMAKAVVNAAIEKHLDHEEMHSKVEYIVAHGIATTIGQARVIIGSYHFVFEDEECKVPEGYEAQFAALPDDCSLLYLAIDHKLAGVICIADPLRENTKDVIRSLKELGISKIVMMTGDSYKTAESIAAEVGVDEFYAEVLPEDKASFVEDEKAKGRTVVMVGDGINDSPALSAADVGIAVSDGAQIAREIADIILMRDDISYLVTLKQISDGLQKRIHWNYKNIVGFNSGLIVLGILGILQPTTSALLHNTSTLLIGLHSMKDVS